GPPDMYSMGSPVLASTTTLREISVIPQPAQKPHPQVWQPVTSPRSIGWAAERGVNCFTVPEPTSRLVGNVERYYADAEAAGWPDRLDRGPFKFGWDSEKKRGYGCCRYIHLLDPDNPDADMERFKLGLELQWDYYGPFGFAAVLADANEDPYPLDMRVTADLLIDKQVAIVGTPDQVVEQIMAVKEGVGYEDFLFATWFEIGGYSHEEVEQQMRWFASDCMPQLADACGGMVVNPPANAVAPEIAAAAAGE
ncbi:MAG: hypothetical protein OXG42_08340, partial [Chloroflexi bacterium]|nr:hypothetical protein [Chloroflexota bacterium]